MACTTFRAVVLLATVSLSSGSAAAQTIEGLHGPAAETLAEELRATDFLDPMEVTLLYGDLNEDGADDAVALIYHATGGNSMYLDTWLLWERGGRYEVVKDSPLQEIVGETARDAVFAPGQFEVTMTVLNPGDARCCPSGERRFVIELGGAAPSSSDATSADVGERAATPESIGGAPRAVALPFADGRYLSDQSLCGLDDGEIVDRIGDEIHYVLYVIEDGQVGGADSFCEVSEVSRDGDLVQMDAACATEGSVFTTVIEMTFLSETAFQASGQVFERCE